MPNDMGATNYELWLRACEEFGTDIYCLAAIRPGTRFFKVNKSYTENGRTYYTSPVYIGWVDGEQVVDGLNYHEAVQIWRNRVNDRFLCEPCREEENKDEGMEAATES